jgi:hypothetical protein
MALKETQSAILNKAKKKRMFVSASFRLKP